MPIANSDASKGAPGGTTLHGPGGQEVTAQARCEALDAVAELGQCRVEAGGIACRDGVGDGPVHCCLAAKFLVGQVGHGDDEIAVVPDVADMAGPGTSRPAARPAFPSRRQQP